MKDATIITNFNQIGNRIKKMEEANQYNFKEVMKNQAAISLTFEAIMDLLKTKGIINGEEELKTAIQNVHAKRSEKIIQAKEQQIENQPVFETDSSVPAPGEEASIEGEQNGN